MLEINQNTKIYIVIPYIKSGGAKSLHQLAERMLNMGMNSFVLYYDEGKVGTSKSILFSEYKVKFGDRIEDKKENIMIVPEIRTELFEDYQDIRKVIWWLSLYYFQLGTNGGCARSYLAKKGFPQFFFPAAVCMKIIKDRITGRKRQISSGDLRKVYHLYNCEYVKNYLIKKRVDYKKMSFLCGPIETSFLNISTDEVISNKENVISYNAEKMDMAFWRKVESKIKQFNVTSIPIKNMSRAEVFSTLKRSKVYIDFGFFPGPERMPREAVSLYCAIITSTKGSAKNEVDVPISKQYKFELVDSNILKISQLIVDMIQNYDSYVHMGDNYREKVQKQIEMFEEDILKAFEVKNKK